MKGIKGTVIRLCVFAGLSSNRQPLEKILSLGMWAWIYYSCPFSGTSFSP